MSSLLTALPTALVLGIAGLGLLGTIGNSLSCALSDVGSREAAVITFLATASGVTLLGIGSAFWGLLAGALTVTVTRGRLPRRLLTPDSSASLVADPLPVHTDSNMATARPTR